MLRSARPWAAPGAPPGWFASHILVRLKSASDFERVRRDGRSHAHPLVVLLARRRPTDGQGEAAPTAPARFGFAAGKGVGPAVRRNRAKRLLREAVRGRAPALPPGWDIVLIARPPLAEARLPQAQAAVDHLLRRAGLLKAA